MSCLNYCLTQLAIGCFMTFLRGLLTQNVVLMSVSYLHVLLVLVIRRSTNCDSLMELGRSLTFPILISVSQELHQTSKFSDAQIFRSVDYGPFEAQVVLRTIFVSTFIDNFYDAFFQHRLIRNDGVDAVCQISFLCRGQENSVLCILFRSSMILMIHLPRFLNICNCFCFVCIIDGEEDCLIFFFTFFSFCHQSSFCNWILISCLILMRQQSVCTLLLQWTIT